MNAAVGLLGNAIASGVLLGGFYAAVSIGLSISFGMLDVVNLAHRVFIVLGSYGAWLMSASLGLDPIATGIVLLPLFYLLGAGIYQIYYLSFERRGEQPMLGLAFFSASFSLRKPC